MAHNTEYWVCDNLLASHLKVHTNNLIIEIALSCGFQIKYTYSIAYARNKSVSHLREHRFKKNLNSTSNVGLKLTAFFHTNL